MGLFTDILKLFLTNMATDGDDYFDFERDINQPFRIIDAEIGELKENKADKSGWVAKQIILTRTQTAGTYIFDLSEYLPKNEDNSVYEVIFNYAQTNTVSASGASIGTDCIPLFDIAVSGANSIYHVGVLTLPVKKQITYKLSADTNYPVTLAAHGYRKVN